MERFYGEKQEHYNTRLPSHLKEIDLTLKLSSCGENVEERRLIRSSSVNVSNWCQFVPPIERSCSLPIDCGKTMLLERQRSVVPAELHGPRHSSEIAVGSNFKMSTKQENDSMIFHKTICKDIPSKSADTKLRNQAKKLNLPNYCSLKGDVMEILRKMPTVTTIGDGPNGKRIEGFLYKYRSGEVCIVCVCHGSFLTPAEFVMHAEGKEVANPMKHITVYPVSL
ncbi:ninja-family protein AFP3-like [Cicer arietinum]|uniref:Ninja-family protein n=1 Tax=Cicer arietinum TaxID=3827 RepID=A0A1S2Y7K7_CICAR|nr:ninja-family protein AFP3-like [Cicer arietinum]XP_027190059.1 ninja-family protein AFP3-like [Cicer arietinum]